jgi:hypothetical protein
VTNHKKQAAGSKPSRLLFGFSLFTAWLMHQAPLPAACMYSFFMKLHTSPTGNISDALKAFAPANAKPFLKFPFLAFMSASAMQ